MTMYVKCKHNMEFFMDLVRNRNETFYDFAMRHMPSPEVTLKLLGVAAIGGACAVGAAVALVASGPIMATALIFGGIGASGIGSVLADKRLVQMGVNPVAAQVLATSLQVAAISLACFALISVCAYSAPVVLGLGSTIIATKGAYEAYKLANQP